MNPTKSPPSLPVTPSKSSTQFQENVSLKPSHSVSRRAEDGRTPLVGTLIETIHASPSEDNRSPKLSPSPESASPFAKVSRFSSRQPWPPIALSPEQVQAQHHSPPSLAELSSLSQFSTQISKVGSPSASASASGFGSMTQHRAQEKKNMPLKPTHEERTANRHVQPLSVSNRKRPRSKSIDSTDRDTKRIRCPSPEPPSQLALQTIWNHLSLEQINVISALKKGNNVQVIGLPGVGKTETAIVILKHRCDRGERVILLTRTEDLRTDVQKRLRETYGTEDYHEQIHSPYSLQRLEHTEHELVILDDCQDYTPEIYSDILPFIGPGTSVAAFGTPHTIFGFLDADPRFLTLASQLFGAHRSWSEFELTVNFVSTCSNTKFLNEILLGPGDPKIKVGDRPGPLPTYLYGHIWDAADLAATAKSLMQDSDFHPGDCAIVVPSLKNLAGKPLSGFVNELTKLGVPVMQPPSDNTPLHPSRAKGKIVPLTYHQFLWHGWRPKMAFILGADASYFQYFGQEEPRDRCPSAILYAVLRTSGKVVFVQDHNFAPLFDGESWVKLPKYADLVKINGTARIPPCRVPTVPHFTCPENITVSELLVKLSTSFLEGVKSKYEVDVKKVDIEGMKGRAPVKPRTLIWTDSKQQLYEGHSWDLETLDANAEDFPLTKTIEEQAQWLAHAAIRYATNRSGLQQRAVALENVPYDWMNDHLAEARERLEKLQASVLPGVLKFKVELDAHKVTVKGYTTKIIGRADIFTEHPGGTSSVSELKCASKLVVKDVLQAVVDAVLWASKTGSPVLPRMFLFNITDGKCLEIQVPGGLHAAKQLLADLVEKHICPGGAKKTSDKEFITKVRKIVE
ncbi:P-loop containing nucleoside triphosphate hydrolase protein [Mycena galericulata]|nr:P-loop containing nucleoside triphosphate hydrolase protein [Mycena galericulata]